jgi:hypothetical protein
VINEVFSLPWTPDTPEELRLRLTLALADKFMTTSTATLPETVAKDAAQDAARLKAAVDAVIRTLQ